MPRGASLPRRDALKALGGSVATVSTYGIATGGSGSTTAVERVRVTVGYAGGSGASAARDRAHEIVYEFTFDALTVVVDGHDIEPLRQHDAIRYVEPDGRYEIAAQSLPWGIDRVDAEVVHGDGEMGNGAHIAIIDTGIDRTHEDLAPNLGKGAAFTGGGQHDQWQDDNGHGTHCAGIAAAVANDTGVVGVAPAATLHAVKVIQAPGAGLSSDVAKGIEWVADQGYDVGSMSIGGDRLRSVADACEYASERGVTLVAAAGNSGPCEDCVRYPAAYPQVIAVSATTGDDQLADFSSQGPEVELAAPGDDVYSTFLGGYATRSGTSMACPHVSGAAGHLATTGYSNDQIRRGLERSAEDIGLSATESGAGLLDVAAAVGDDTSDDKSESPSTDTETPTDTATPRPTATESPGDGVGGGGGAEIGDSRSSSTPTTTASHTPTHPQTATTSHGGRRTQTGTASPTRGPAAPTTRTPIDTRSATASPSSRGGITIVGRLWRRTIGVVETVVGAVDDALTGLLP